VSSGNGKIFTSGIDLTDLSSLASLVYSEEDIARKANTMYHTIRRLQASESWSARNCYSGIRIHKLCAKILIRIWINTPDF
jgi:hypothetical protein